MPRRVLIITYYWPPGGGAGVQRWLKFVKYLPQLGWEPVVYTPSNPEVPVEDHSLDKDIPAGIEVLKTRVFEPYGLYKRFIGLRNDERINAGFLSEKRKPAFSEKIAVWIRGNLFIPDARMFWIRPSVKYLSRYLKHNPVDIIISTGPPHSMHLIGSKVSRRTGIPWIADFRDPWTGIDFYEDLHLTRMADNCHHRLERQVLKNAGKVVVISEGMKTHFNEIHQRHYEVVTNGYDEEDIAEDTVLPDNKFSIAHIGTMAKTRNPVILWSVLKDLTLSEPGFADDLVIKLIGKTDFTVTESIKNAGLEKYLIKTAYLPHDKVSGEQKKARVLLLVINNTPNARMILTGKFFEYLAAKRPILVIGPADGDSAVIISQTGQGMVSGFDDPITLRQHLIQLYKNFRNNCDAITSGNTDQYSRKHLTTRLSELMEKAIRRD